MRNMVNMTQKISGLQDARHKTELSDMQFEANAAGGQVRAVVNGKKHIIRIDIDPALMVQVKLIWSLIW